MKVIVAGSRNITDEYKVREALSHAGLSTQDVTEIVSGGARGVDKLGEDIANFHKIPVKKFPADWETHGRSAGYIRNKEMAEYADMLVAVWDGNSKGTAHMITAMTKLEKRVYVHRVDI